MTKNKTVLLIEDNPDDVELTLRAFQGSNLGSEVVVMHDGVEALEYLFGASQERGRPALVLLDLKMPRMGGFEVLRRIRADPRTELMPVVILTYSGEEEDLVRGYRLGANGYVRKPVEFEDFLEAIRLVGHYWLRVNEHVSEDDTGESRHAGDRADRSISDQPVRSDR